VKDKKLNRMCLHNDLFQRCLFWWALDVFANFKARSFPEGLVLKIIGTAEM